MIEFQTLGGGEEIGANSYYLLIEDTGIILDTGMHPVKTGLEALPNFSLIGNRPVDFIIISHAHQDHLAALPYAVKSFPYAKVIMTPQTLELARLTLHNSVEILKEQMANDKSFVIYDHDEIDMLLRLVEEYAYNTPFELTGYRHRYASDEAHCITGEFINAGHILGAAGTLITQKEQTIFYTGDISLHTQAVLKKANLPSMPVDLLITETTYGSTPEQELRTLKEETGRFAKAANKIIAQGGSILIPVFALGKTQELLAIVSNLMESGKLPTVPIFTGGLGRKINKLYDKNRYLIGVNNTKLELTKIPQERLPRTGKPREVFQEPAIVLASSGMMMPGTASYRLAKHFLKDDNSAIFIVGYAEETTPAFRVAHAAHGGMVRLHDSGEDIPVHCTIKKFRFSSHARRQDLIKMIDVLNPPNIILLHGEEASIDWVGAAILSRNKGNKVYVGNSGKVIRLKGRLEGDF